MSDDMHSFVSDVLHRRGLQDRDDYARRVAVAVGKVSEWSEGAIASALERLPSDVYRRDTTWPKAKVVGLVASRVLQKWPARSGGGVTPDMPVPLIKILFVASNPAEVVALHPANNEPLTFIPLGVDHEFREVQAKLRSSNHRDRFLLSSRPAARPDDLLDALNEDPPQIVHFSGHGTKSSGLVMLDKSGRPQVVSKEAVESLFRVMKDQIRVVVLNACHSKAQAAAIAKHIDCVIGMTTEIGDDAAIAFASSFYRGLASGNSVKNAFDQGLVSLRLEGIPEDATPKLLCRRGVNPATVLLLNE